MNKVLSVIILSAMLFSAPEVIRYSGNITQADGRAISDDIEIIFSIYDTETGGSPLWTETRTVTLTGGQFEIDLGSSSAIDLPFDTQYFIEMEIAGETLSPRDPLATIAYAHRAGRVSQAVQSVSSSADHTGRTGHLRFVPLDGTEITESLSETEDTIYIAIGGEGTGTTDLTPAKPIVIAKSGSIPGSQTEFIETVRIEPPTPGNLFIPTQIRLEHSYSRIKYFINYSDSTSYESDEFSASSSWLTVFDSTIPPHSGYGGFITSIIVEGMRYSSYYTGSVRLSLAGYEVEP